MNQREFLDWFYTNFCPDARAYCAQTFSGEIAAFEYTDIVSQCRTLLDYEGTCYSYKNYRAIFEGWMEDDFEPNLLQWVENDMKKRDSWDGRIEVV